jgi:hypothetical protein
VSVETKAALDAAIAAHISDEVGNGVIVTGYVLKASHLHSAVAEDAHGYFAEFAEDQPHHVALGLAHMIVQQIEENG